MKTNTVCVKSIPQHALRSVADAYNQVLKTVMRLLLFVPFVLSLKVEKKVKQCFQVKERAANYLNLSLNEIIRIIIRDARTMANKSYAV
jgi:hypothetical protein